MTWILIDPRKLPDLKSDVILYHPDWIGDSNSKGVKLGYTFDGGVITATWNFETDEYLTTENDLIPHAYMEIPEFKT